MNQSAIAPAKRNATASQASHSNTTMDLGIAAPRWRPQHDGRSHQSIHQFFTLPKRRRGDSAPLLGETKMGGATALDELRQSLSNVTWRETLGKGSDFAVSLN